MQRRSGSLGAVLFTDIVDSTAIAAEMGNTRWSELVARHHRIVRNQLGRSGGREIDTAGDGFFVIFERPADAIRCAVAAVEAVRALGIEIRAGVSFGELDRSGQKPSGLVVNTAARVMAVAGSSEVLVPVSVKEIVSGVGISFSEHGTHHLKGLDEEFRLFRVTEVDGAPTAPPLDSEAAAERRREIFPTGRRRMPLLAGAAAGALALVVVGVLMFTGGAEPAEDPRPLRNAVARFDVETGEVRSPLYLGDRPFGGAFAGDIDRAVSAGEGGVWVLQPPFLLHVDPLHEDIRSDQIDVGTDESQSVHTGLGKVWVLTGRTVYEVHPATDEATIVYQLPRPAGLITLSLAVSDALWLGTSDGTLIRFDPFSGDERITEIDSSIGGLAATRDGVWLTDIVAGTITRVDPETLDVIGKPISLEGGLDRIGAIGRYVWVLDRQVGTVTRIDASSGADRDVRVGDEPTEMAVTEDAVWVGDRDGWLYQVDSATLDVARHRVGAEVLGVDVDATEGSPWVYVGDPVGR
ncbi:MAG: hydrolase [Actinomycetia bacterium]|jgi:class 3 adenylate cyclase/streptogramin lyase|nr:hydrolase [Actinomycetes bacterium]